MLKHIFKLIWNRKRANGLIIAEIFISFLVLFAVVAGGVYYVGLWFQDLGFRYQDVWSVRLDTGGPWSGEDAATVERLMSVLETLDPVEDVAALNVVPFTHSTWTSTMEFEDKSMEPMVNVATDGFAEMVGLEITEGRWFGREDDGVDWRSVVISERAREELFGKTDPLGQNIAPTGRDGTRGTELRVVGVMREFRQNGELSALRPYVFYRYRVGDPESRQMRALHVKLRPGTTAGFEQELLETLHAVAPTWHYEIKTWERMRHGMHMTVLAPLLAGSIVAGFLLLMVALGLLGVLWQSVNQRTPEIGLRRAMGAPTGRIKLQITGELMMISTLGMVLGVFVAIQLPLTGMFPFLGPAIMAWSLIGSILAIYGLSVLCALYPSWLATRIPPAAALHYE